MEITPAVVLWRTRGAEHFVQCIVEETGEACFELRILCGHELLLAESFQETAPMLARAEALRAQYAPRRSTGRGGASTG
ncbi:MAG: hypothetical protein HYU52_05320 [Acidobacteria bacterium]|nr:hypothetical protein [Acidobacteriota bacterium]